MEVVDLPSNGAFAQTGRRYFNCYAPAMIYYYRYWQASCAGDFPCRICFAPDMTRLRLIFAMLLVLFAGGIPRSPYAAGPIPATVPDTVEQRLLACATCHGKNGEGARKGETYPRLAGKADGYLYNQLLNFRDGRRKNPAMNYLLGYLPDAYLREIAHYYSQLQPPYPDPVTGVPGAVLARGEALVMKGDTSRNLPACSECHGKTLAGTAPFIPGLVGLSASYIRQQMGAWQARNRHAAEPDCMAKVAALLSPEEISAVTAWLAAQPAPKGAPQPAGAAPKLPMDCGSVPPR
jgi:cytochrome c553